MCALCGTAIRIFFSLLYHKRESAIYPLLYTWAQRHGRLAILIETEHVYWNFQLRFGKSQRFLVPRRTGFTASPAESTSLSKRPILSLIKTEFGPRLSESYSTLAEHISTPRSCVYYMICSISNSLCHLLEILSAITRFWAHSSSKWNPPELLGEV